MRAKMKRFGLLAGYVLASGALYAASVTNTFENGVGIWTGDGTTGESNFTYTAVAGLPASSSLPNPNSVLLVEGTASCSPSFGSSNTKPLMDLMVQTAHPDDELSTDDLGNVHIAVAVDSNGYFNVYCKNKLGTAGWYQLSASPYDDSAWARVSLLFDYDNKRCQVRIDGQPMMTANGYLKADTDQSDTSNGAWYRFANDGANVSTMQVIGCTAIDEVVLNETSESYAIAAAAKVGDISCAWFDQYGLAWDATQSYDSSKKADGTTAMTVADKYKYCFSPFEGQGEADFAVKSITTTAEKVTLTLPTTVETAGRQLVVDYGTDKTFTTYSTTEEVTGDATVQIDIPAPGSVTYYRLRTTTK